ncbi:tannase/feruloyl esterase family alpha/beta hydrolase [Paraburkholderia metrosideri]|uniref:Tannase/feruloyl esterase family alpha/beta hydrolase n=1 Tax=Paraburkholderia metrosideri TaxID=580937 RepID=A0ABW9E2V7_9BURK
MNHVRDSRVPPWLVRPGMPVLIAACACAVMLAACGDTGSNGLTTATAKPLTCDDSMKAAFKPDANTTVTLVKAFKKGDDLNLNGTSSGVLAANDECLVKLNVGPGNQGPAGAPSTSQGIGIEVWLPTPANWNNRIHAYGGGGFAGDPTISSLTEIGNLQGVGGSATPADIAGVEGAVSADTDTGHVSTDTVALGPFLGPLGDGAFAMNPDGSINTTLWTDFASRGIHEMAVVAKALATAYYTTPVKYSYWDGCSTGGRQGHEEAQVNPGDFDGILAGDPGINWSSALTGFVYPQTVMRQDLGGVPLTTAQLSGVSAAAVSACDSTLTGKHDGFISNPDVCTYDPTQDKTVLCPSSGGTNATAACVSTVQAQAINKMWYGQTVDGSAPAPAVANGFSQQLQPNQLWFGLERGTLLGSVPNGTSGLAASTNGVPAPFTPGTSQVALELQKSTLATPDFINATGDGMNGWESLSYADLANASAQGLALQPQFGNIDANNPDLTNFKAHNGKMIVYHGMADEIVPIQGTTNYYVNVAAKMGGIPATQAFYRYFQIPGMAHCAGIGSVNGVTGVSPVANPPLPAPNQFYNALTSWVEKGVAPDKIPLQNSDASITRPICMYPSKLTYSGGSAGAASSFICS